MTVQNPRPEQLELVSLRDLGKVVTGTTPSTAVPAYFDGPFQFITPGDIGDSKFVQHTERHLSEEGLRVCRELPKNSIVVTCIGNIGRVGITAVDRSATNQQINALIPNERILSGYLYYSLLFHAPALSTLASRTVVPIVKKSIFADFCIPLRPLPDQRAFVLVLDAVQNSKMARYRELALERERKAALMEYLFTRGTRGEPTKQTEIGEIPQSWQAVRLGQIARIGNGSTPKRSDERYWKGGTIPWITSTQIHDVVIEQASEFVTETARKECHLPLVSKNSIVVAITGQGKTLGNAAILAIDTCMNQHLAYIQLERPSVQAEFVLVYLQSRYNYLRGVSSAGGSTKGALTCGFLKAMSVPVPSHDEQSAISGLLLTCEKKCRCLEREVAMLEELFRAILEELMSGRLSALPLIEEHQPQ